MGVPAVTVNCRWQSIGSFWQKMAEAGPMV
ncbi:hypothetical protein EMIT0324P_11548 [Pseudomonas chlororaphis]